MDMVTPEPRDESCRPPSTRGIRNFQPMTVALYETAIGGIFKVTRNHVFLVVIADLGLVVSGLGRVAQKIQVGTHKVG